jgi:excisionase family DNA binding protein
MGDEKKVIAIGEAANYLGISRDTLRRWEKRGRLKALRSPTNRRFYTKEQLDRLMSGEKITKGAKKENVGKPLQVSTRRLPKLIALAGLSFIIAALLALLLQFFLIK